MHFCNCREEENSFLSNLAETNSVAKVIIELTVLIFMRWSLLNTKIKTPGHSVGLNLNNNRELASTFEK